jgi:Zn-dependent M28 family amino/carboxypeptidase
MRTKIFRTLLVLTVLLVTIVPTALADNGTDSTALRNAVTLGGVRAHQQEFQDIADANGDTRVAGTAGHDLSAEYVFNLLDGAGYNVSYQPFDFAFFEELTPSQLEQTAPGAEVYTYLDDFFTMDYSGSGDVTATVQAVDLLLPPTGGSTSGCDGDFAEVGAGGFGNTVPDPTGPDDFASFTPGNIALIQRGTCSFQLKALDAQSAGASAVIVFNEGNTPDREPLFGGTLGGPNITIPVLSASFAFGVELNNLIVDGLELHMVTDTTSEIRTTNNVIAETPTGRTDRVVVVGAHLDSVSAGPGINDNGSGSAAILEIALQMAELGIQPRNQVRFIWFSAEESGLVGSAYYVSQLTKSQIKRISVMLNFDMIGSPNFVRFVYDGDGSGTGTVGPNGSDVVEDVFLDYFGTTPTEPTAFDGRSDYGPFIDVGIPAGGLFTGAEGIKTAAQAAIYGGTVGDQYDPCYHEDCDTFANNSDTALDQMSDAAAHAVLTFAMTTSAVNGTDKGKGQGQADLEFLGSKLQK